MSSKHSKIEEIYLKLSKIEKDNILEFLKCSIFNQSEVIIAIHIYLSENFTKKTEIDKVDLYKSVFNQKEKYSDVKLRVFVTKLAKLIEKYLVIKGLDHYPTTELSVLNEYYRKNHLQKNYSVFYSSKPEHKFNYYEEYLNYEYMYAVRKLDYINTEFANDGDKIRVHFEAMLNAHQNLSFFQTLKSQCDFLSFSQKYRNERDSSYEESIIQKLIDKKEEQNTVVKAYILFYQLSKDNNEELFLELKDIIVNIGIEYESNYRGLISHTQNICVRFINSGKTNYLTHLFEIYKIELKYFKNAGDLNDGNFRNIIFCALQLKELEWAEKFVEEYYLKVQPEIQENTYNYNYARIYFEKKEYKLAMRQLIKVNYYDSFYASTSRILLIKCYYELNEELALISNCGSLIQFLNRSKDFTKQRIENYLHFIKFVKALQSHRLKNDKKYFNNLQSKINESTVAEKEWLLKKIEALIN